MDAYVALLVIDLVFPEAGDLKGKRKELASLKAQIQGRCGAAVAEVAHQDTWQRSTLTAAVTSGSLGSLEHQADGVERLVRSRYPDGVSIRRVVASLEDLES